MTKNQTQISPSGERLIGKIQSKLNQIEGMFVTPKDLANMGLFPTSGAAFRFVRMSMPHIEIGVHKVLVTKEDVISLIQGNFKDRGRAA